MSLLKVGDRVGGFEIEAYVARGGMAMVYRAREIGLGRTVALKVIAPDLAQDPTFRRRFTQESQLAASIDHPNIIPIFAAGEADGQLYLVMRYVDGDTLADVFAEQGPLEPDDALAVFTQVAGALDAAHGHHLVHRDVKPRNILLTPGEELAQRHVYLTDFGLTKRLSGDDTLTSTGQFFGTTRYVAPEQISHAPISSRADVYSLGCVIVEALTGKPPFVRDDDVSLLWAHVSDDPPAVSERRPSLPDGVDSALRQALAKDPDERQPTCGALVAELTTALTAAPEATAETVVSREPTAGGVDNGDADGPPTVVSASSVTPVLPPPVSTVPARPAPPRRRRRRLPILLAALVVLVAGTGVAVLAWQGRLPLALPVGSTSAGSTSASPSTEALPQSAEPLPADTLVWRREDDGRWTIGTMTLDGEIGTVLLNGRQNRSVQLTPDRRTVLYLRESDGRMTLRAIAADGEQDRALFTDGTPECPRMSRPSVRADGVLALFCADATAGRGALNLMSLDGTLLRVLDEGRIGDPGFTPDGRFVVYWRSEAEGSAGGSLFRFAADGTGTRERIVTGDAQYSDPVVSPAGDKVLASRIRGEGQEIVAVDLGEQATSSVDRLTRGYIDSGPSWSPDGSEIMFRRGSDEESDLYVMDAGGTDVRSVFHSDGYGSQPVWTAQ